MRDLFVIFAATTGYVKPVAYSASLIFITLLAGTGFWFWADYKEVSLREDVECRRRICAMLETSGDPQRLLTEREGLARAESAHRTFLRSAVTRVFVPRD